ANHSERQLRQTLIKIQEAQNQIVTDYEVCNQRPDSTLLIKSIEAHQQKLGRLPHTVAVDAGFFSTPNETGAKEDESKTRGDSPLIQTKYRTTIITRKAASLYLGDGTG